MNTIGLKLAVTTDDGAEHADAFWKIINVGLSPDTDEARVSLVAWNRQEDHAIGKQQLSCGMQMVIVTPVVLTDIDTMVQLREALYSKVKEISSYFASAELVQV